MVIPSFNFFYLISSFLILSFLLELRFVLIRRCVKVVGMMVIVILYVFCSVPH